MKKTCLVSLALATSVLLPAARAVDLIAIGTISGAYEDLSTSTAAPLENGVAGNLLGGIGSGLAYAGGNTFLALPDRGPNANPYNSAIDDTVSYIPRFQTLSLSLAPRTDPVTGLPFTLTPMVTATTLLHSGFPLYYGSGAGLGNRIDGVTPVGSGAPALNAIDHTYYYSGRSDNFNGSQLSTYRQNARLDPEGIRVSNNGAFVYISDEYGPFVRQFDRATGRVVRTYELPANLAITHLSPQKDVEIDGNTVGRVTNKGMEGLAITPDGTMLVGMMQANLEQDKKKSLRLVTIDLASGTTHEYAYKLTDGSGVSEIVAVNNHQFLVDERDGTGLGDTPQLTDTASAAVVKELFLIDLDGATDVTEMAGDLSDYAVTKTLFLDIVGKLTGAGINAFLIPSKIEGIAFGQDIDVAGVTMHTLFVANDNDFLATVADPFKGPDDTTRGEIANPNQIYVFAFSDDELPGFVQQPFRN
ncbi:MAG TPA: esterase-like activity of phytase family protein [Opitutus sp.]|nr:esterase-like activity of phytase family protein [Opitutus sp.]